MTERSESNQIGTYANYLVVGHNAFEFVLDFGQVYEGNDVGQMHTRIVTTPVYARAMLETLQASIAQFETNHGPIPDAKGRDE
jgi:Protein of unknown function (DUF3467)